MVDNPHEAAAFARIAGGVLVNLGTPYDNTVVAMEGAVSAATDHGTPWVLDPVAAGALEWRTKVALDLLALGRPAVIRGNASEVLALTGGAGGKGVDSAHTPESAADAARALAGEHRTFVAGSGPRDHLTHGKPPRRVPNGPQGPTPVTRGGSAPPRSPRPGPPPPPPPRPPASSASTTATSGSPGCRGWAAPSGRWGPPSPPSSRPRCSAPPRRRPRSRSRPSPPRGPAAAPA